MAIGLLALMAIAFTACTRTTSPVQGTISIPNGLGMGGSDDGITVEFLEVVADSRCAEGVTCVQQGKADVKIGVTVDGGARQDAVLEVTPGRTTTQKFDRFQVELVRLLPDPPHAGGVEQSEYELELRITED